MLKRTITGFVGLAILLGAIWVGQVWVFLLVIVVALAAVREIYRLHPPANVTLAPHRPAPPEKGEWDEGLEALAPHRPAPPRMQQRWRRRNHNRRPQRKVGAAPAPDAGSARPAPPSHGEDAEPPQAPGAAPAPTPLPFLLGGLWVVAFVIVGAGASGVLQFWAISLGVFVVGAFVSGLWLIAFYRGPRWPVAAAYLLCGPVYTGFLLAHAMQLVQIGEVFYQLTPVFFDPYAASTIYELGRNWLIFALLTTFATDSGAYLVGRAIGRHPMAPVTSPNKTWEGAIGGFICAAAAALVLDRILYLGLGPTLWDGAWLAWNWQAVAIGATVGAASQFGDLLESRLKRLSQVKDSGSLIPGHGGMLDRLDSLLVTLPTVYYLLVLVLQP